MVGVVTILGLFTCTSPGLTKTLMIKQVTLIVTNGEKLSTSTLS